MTKYIAVKLTEDQLWQLQTAINQHILRLELSPLGTTREINFFKRIEDKLAKAKTV